MGDADKKKRDEKQQHLQADGQLVVGLRQRQKARVKQRMKDPRQVSQLKVLEHNKGDVNFLSFEITLLQAWLYHLRHHHRSVLKEQRESGVPSQSRLGLMYQIDFDIIWRSPVHHHAGDVTFSLARVWSLSIARVSTTTQPTERTS